MGHEQVMEVVEVSNGPVTSRPWLRPLAIGVAIVAAMVVARALGLGDRLGEARLWIESLGPWGPVVFALVYAVATVAAIPGSVITVAAGAMFGSVLGVAVVGGGPIGTELAQAFARLGSEVVIVEMADQFLPREDRDAAQILRGALERDGIDVRLSTTLERVETEGADKVLFLRTPDGEHSVAVDAILDGVGRTANVEDLNLEAAGVEYDRTGVKVNDFLQTSNRKIYASGDVCLPHKFTHTADAASRAVVQNAFFSTAGRKRISRLVVPWVTYTDPEVAHVGMYEYEARGEGIDVDTITIPMSDVDRALADGEEEGFLKVHVRPGKGQILGATIVARHAGEMISEITMAMVTGVGLGSIAGVIHPYPTQSEAIRKAADALNRTRLTPRVAGLLRRWFALRR